jgi:hypothetical protein
MVACPCTYVQALLLVEMVEIWEPLGSKNEKKFTELLTEKESCGIIRKGMV